MTTKEQGQSGVQETEAGFSLDDALNTKGFAEFLAKYPDAAGLEMDENTEEVEKRFEAFELQKEVTKDIARLYRSKIEKDLGVKLSEEDLKSVGEFLERQVIEDPESLSQLQAQAAQFESLSESVADKEEQLEQLGGQKGLRQAMKKLEVASRTFGFNITSPKTWGLLGHFFRSKEERAARKWAKKDLGLKSFSDVQERMKLIEDAQDLMKLREQFFEDLAPAKQILDAANHKALNVLEALLEGGKQDIRKYDEAQEVLAKYAKAQESLEYFESDNLEDLQKDLDKLIDAKIRKDIADALTAFTTSGSSPLSRLEKALSAHFTREKLGSKEGQEARDAVVAALEGALAGAELPKQILLKRLIIKVRNYEL